MKSLRTALSLYALFSGNQRDWGVGELAEATELTKSRVSKVLAAFRDAGLLRQDPVTRRYQVDRRAFVIGSRFLVHDPLSREALPIMRELGSATGHSARLSIRDGDDLIYLLTLEGPHFVDTGWRAGAILPWHATTAGRVLLAYMSDVEREALLGAGPLEKLTERTVTDRRELARILASVRRDGFSSARGESTAGLGAIAAPVLGPDQKVSRRARSRLPRAPRVGFQSGKARNCIMQRRRQIVSAQRFASLLAARRRRSARADGEAPPLSRPGEGPGVRVAPP